MKKNRKYFIISILIIAVLVFSMYFAYLIAPGIHVNAERYEFELSFNELKLQIDEFKVRNPQYRVFKDFDEEKGIELDNYSNLDGTNVTVEDSARYYSCFFYFSDIETTVSSGVNIYGKNKENPVTLELVSVTTSPYFGSWKTINTKDLTKDENAFIKKKFETEILDSLGKWRRCN